MDRQSQKRENGIVDLVGVRFHLAHSLAAANAGAKPDEIAL
jgi:hypothetical protein